MLPSSVGPGEDEVPEAPRLIGEYGLFQNWRGSGSLWEALVQSRHITLLSLHVSPVNGEKFPEGTGKQV